MKSRSLVSFPAWVFEQCVEAVPCMSAHEVMKSKSAHSDVPQIAFAESVKGRIGRPSSGHSAWTASQQATPM
jgi:hypothetical protein